MIALSEMKAQSGTKVFKSKFLPTEVTYNGSPNPNECWESVASGINIKVGKTVSFFSMAYQEIERLKEIIGNAEVQIEVIYYNEPEDGSGAKGEVKIITLNDKLIFENK